MQPILLPPDMPHIEMIDADYEAEKACDSMGEAWDMSLAEGDEDARYKKYDESHEQEQRVLLSGFQLVWQSAEPSPMLLEMDEREDGEARGNDDVRI